MKKSLAIKLGLMAGIIVLLLLPIAQIKGVVGERHIRHQEVIRDIAASSSTEQTLTGPVLVQPYTETVKVWKKNRETGERELELVDQKGELYFLPESLQIDANLTNEERSRGIYETQLYHADSRLKGHFSIPENLTMEEGEYRFHKPYLMLVVSDMRGIESAVKLSWGGKTVEVLPGPNSARFKQGVHAYIPALPISGLPQVEFDISLRLQGTTSLDFIPVGKETRVKLQSDWPHPSFGGHYLPIQREISDEGFSAFWEMSYFSTNIEDLAESCFSESKCKSFNGQHFGVSFIDPVDLYVKTDRAIKYAIVFVLLTFVGVFLFEVLKRLRVHPIQYALVGLAIAMFYLLLMSLAEHIAFALAYSISALACASLIGAYTSFALKSSVRGGYFGLGLLFLYGLFYGLLSSEDYALLTGGILAFAVLAIVMLTTGRLDWYKLGEQLEPFSAKEKVDS